MEISIRGGAARWGGPALPGMDEAVAVSRFEVVRGFAAMRGIYAVLPGGERRRVFGPWSGGAEKGIDRLLEGMNANLGTVESSVATLAPTEGGSPPMGGPRA